MKVRDIKKLLSERYDDDDDLIIEWWDRDLFDCTVETWQHVVAECEDPDHMTFQPYTDGIFFRIQDTIRYRPTTIV